MSDQLTMVNSVLLAVSVLVVVTGAASPYNDPHFTPNRSVIVQLFEWKFSEVAKECQNFLGPKGFGGIQVSPVTENVVIMINGQRPWLERYQPVSYKIGSRSGNETQFKDMVDKCNKAGVRIYVEILLNHMGIGSGQGVGTAGSKWNANSEQYDGVPYTAADFHDNRTCHTDDQNIHDYDNAEELRNCRLYGQPDLDQSLSHVRQAQVDFLNHLVDLGVAGFMSYGSKYIWPKDLKAILDSVHNLNTRYFPANSRPFVVHDAYPPQSSNAVGISEYMTFGRNLGFQVMFDLKVVFRKLNDQLLKNLKNFGEQWNLPNSDDVVTQIDSIDRQRDGSSINFRQDKLLKTAMAFMLSWPYGQPKVMSSYYWPQNVLVGVDLNANMGPPSTNGSINDVVCDPKLWICEHRWRQISNMVKLRNVAGEDRVDNWWDNGYHSIAYSRGNKTFVAINNDIQPINAKLKTGLPAGTYCDVISGDLFEGKCTGKQVTVDSERNAQIFVDNKSDDPILAFHIESKLK